MPLLRSLLEEMTTGTGAEMTPGAGEQIASPFAFKRKRRLIRKKLTEAEVEVSYTPEGWSKEFDKCVAAMKDFKAKVERFINVFEAYEMKEMIDNADKLKQFVKLGEALGDGLWKVNKKLWDLADQADEDNRKEEYKKAMELTNYSDKLDASVSAITNLLDSMEHNLQNYRDQKS